MNPARAHNLRLVGDHLPAQITHLRNELALVRFVAIYPSFFLPSGQPPADMTLRDRKEHPLLTLASGGPARSDAPLTCANVAGDAGAERTIFGMRRPPATSPGPRPRSRVAQLVAQRRMRPQPRARLSSAARAARRPYASLLLTPRQRPITRGALATRLDQLSARGPTEVVVGGQRFTDRRLGERVGDRPVLHSSGGVPA